MLRRLTLGMVNRPSTSASIPQKRCGSQRASISTPGSRSIAGSLSPVIVERHVSPIHRRPIAIGQLKKSTPRSRPARVRIAKCAAWNNRTTFRAMPVRHVTRESNLCIVVIGHLMVDLHKCAVQVFIGWIAEVTATVKRHIRRILRIRKETQFRMGPMPEILSAGQPGRPPSHPPDPDVGEIALSLWIVLRCAAAVRTHVPQLTDTRPMEAVRRSPPLHPMTRGHTRTLVSSTFILLSAPPVVRLLRIEPFLGIGIKVGTNLTDGFESFFGRCLRIFKRCAGRSVRDDVVSGGSLPLDLTPDAGASNYSRPHLPRSRGDAHRRVPDYPSHAGASYRADGIFPHAATHTAAPSHRVRPTPDLMQILAPPSAPPQW